MKTKTLTTEVEILRDALKKAMTCLDDVTHYHTPESRDKLIVRILNEVEILIVKADAVKGSGKIGYPPLPDDRIKAGPSEEDKERIIILLKNLEEDNYCDGTDAIWLSSQVKKYMGIE